VALPGLAKIVIAWPLMDQRGHAVPGHQRRGGSEGGRCREEAQRRKLGSHTI